MFEGDLDTARELAMDSGKWIMITVSDPSEFASEVMKRDIWRVPAVKALVQENFVFLFFDVNSDDGLRHRTFYPFSGFPYVAILDPRTGERLRVWSKIMSEGEFRQDISEFLDGHNLTGFEPPSKGKASVVPLVDLTEDEQLEAAIAESLHDGASGTKVEASPSNAWTSIEPEDLPEPAGPDTTRIQFRLLDGSRVVRKFRKTDTVRSLFAFVKGKLPESGRFELDLSLESANVLNSSLSVEPVDD
ncbi:hypothetical protein HK405_006707 [Cladochytrium tenue]|nr:hypothetical protein HK405_006707 [Cladochytrium tenue]